MCIPLLTSFVLQEHLVLSFHIYTFILLFTDQKKKKDNIRAKKGKWLSLTDISRLI